MKTKITLFFVLLFCIFSIQGNAQTQFWSDSFEDAGAPSSGSRTPSIAEFSCGGPPSTAYFKRTDLTGISMYAGTYSNFQGTKFWAAEDIDKGPTCVNSSITANQQVTWSSLNIAGKTGITFKGLFAANNVSGNYQGTDWIAASQQDFIAIEYRIDGGAWTKAIGIYGNAPNFSNVFSVDTNGDFLGDGTALTYSFTELTANITGTGTTLDLRFNCFVNASGTQEIAVDNFRLFEAPACISPTAYNVTGTNSYCSGGSGVAIGLSNSEIGVTYQLKNGAANVGSPVTGTAAAISFGNQTTAATYTVVATRTAGGCSNNMTGSATVTIASLPATPTATTTAATCSANGTATIANYAANLTYTSTPTGATVGALGAISGTAGTAYTFTATNTSNCSSTASASVTIPVKLTAPATPTATTTAATCSANGTATIANYAANLTYTSTPAGATVGALGAISGTAGTAYTFTATNTSNCTSAVSASVTIPVKLTAPATPTATTTAATCSANGTATIANYAANLTYTSTPTGATVGALGVISGTAGTAYTFTATNTSNCTSTASASVTIPVQLTININDEVTQNLGELTATQSGATYQWYNCSNNSLVGTNSSTFTPTQSGDYKVAITVGACTVTSECISVATLGTANFETNSTFLIYPNPSQGIITVKTDKKGDYQVVNLLGQTVKTFTMEANSTKTIDLQDLNESIYFIREISNPNNKSHKLIIKK